MGLAARVTLVVLLVAVLLPALASACPLCKDAKSDTDYPGGTASLSSGFYYSILLMVAAPFLVVGGLIFRIVLGRRRLLLRRKYPRGRCPSPGSLPTPGERSPEALSPHNSRTTPAVPRILGVQGAPRAPCAGKPA